MGIRIALVTCPDMSVAQDLAKQVVGFKLAACVNIMPGITSVYWWENSVNTDTEVLLFIKTTKKLADSLEQKVLELHPYDTPEFVVLKPSAVTDKYKKWLIDSIGG